MAALATHGRIAAVVELACDALWKFTVGNPENREKCFEAGAIEAVVTAMKAHTGHAGIIMQVGGRWKWWGGGERGFGGGGGCGRPWWQVAVVVV